MVIQGKKSRFIIISERKKVLGICSLAYWFHSILLLYRGLGEANLEDEEIAAEDEEDMGVIETYSNYMPSKLKVIFQIRKYR